MHQQVKNPGSVTKKDDKEEKEKDLRVRYVAFSGNEYKYLWPLLLS